MASTTRQQKREEDEIGVQEIVKKASAEISKALKELEDVRKALLDLVESLKRGA